MIYHLEFYDQRCPDADEWLYFTTAEFVPRIGEIVHLGKRLKANEDFKRYQVTSVEYYLREEDSVQSTMISVMILVKVLCDGTKSN